MPRARESTRDLISIDDLRVECVVGVYPQERDAPQPLRIDVEMAVDTARAGARQRLAMTLDYAAVASQIAFILQSARFQMLETAAHALSRYLLAPPASGEDRPRVQSVSLRLTKPLALGGKGIPSLKIQREANDVVLGHEIKAFGTVDVVHETRDAGIYRLNIAPGRAIPTHVHRVMSESEMVLGEGLLLNGKPVAIGTAHRWPLETPHRYDNPSDRWQSILCVDCPRFIPEDEIEVDAAPVDVPAEPSFLQTPLSAGTQADT